MAFHKVCKGRFYPEVKFTKLQGYNKSINFTFLGNVSLNIQGQGLRSRIIYMQTETYIQFGMYNVDKFGNSFPFCISLLGEILFHFLEKKRNWITSLLTLIRLTYTIFFILLPKEARKITIWMTISSLWYKKTSDIQMKISFIKGEKPFKKWFLDWPVKQSWQNFYVSVQEIRNFFSLILWSTQTLIFQTDFCLWCKFLYLDLQVFIP